MRSPSIPVRIPPLALVATACLGLATHPLSAEPIATAVVYGFAQQKIYGMTLTAAPGASAQIVADPLGFGVTMATQAAIDTAPGVVANVGGIDAAQSFIGSGVPAQPVENYSGTVFPGMSQPANERVLLQLNPTAAGVPRGFDTAAPASADFLAGRNFARSDGYVTPYPDTVTGTGSGQPPAGWPANGSAIAGSHLFAPVGTPDTLSIDLAAEALLNGESFATIAGGMADWTATGRFTIVGAGETRASVSLDFNVVERLVIHSWNPGIDMATVSNAFSFDVFDSTGRSVFGPFLGSAPSSTRMLSTAAAGSVTYNNNTMIPTHIYPGPVNMNFQTVPLAPGAYAFQVKGTTTAVVTALPEPATWVSLVAAAACGAVASRRLRRLDLSKPSARGNGDPATGCLGTDEPRRSEPVLAHRFG